MGGARSRSLPPGEGHEPVFVLDLLFPDNHCAKTSHTRSWMYVRFFFFFLFFFGGFHITITLSLNRFASSLAAAGLLLAARHSSFHLTGGWEVKNHFVRVFFLFFFFLIPSFRQRRNAILLSRTLLTESIVVVGSAIYRRLKQPIDFIYLPYQV